MTDRDVEATVRHVMAEVLEISPDSVGPGVSRQTARLWDSLHHVKLVIALEDSLDLEYSLEEIAAMNSYESIAAFSRQHADP